MKKNGVLIVVVLSFILMSVTYVMADINVLGEPRTFIRGTGQPTTEYFNFACSEGMVTAVLTNGGLEDDSVERVSSSVISIDELVLFNTSDFNQNVNQLEKIIHLDQGTHTLGVELRGKPNGSVTIKLMQAEVPPEIILDESNSISIVLSKEGGQTLTTDANGIEYLLTIPPNALTESVEITLTPVSSVANIPYLSDSAVALQMSPSGLNFLFPATLSITLPPNYPLDEIVGYLFNDDGSGFHLYPTQSDGNVFNFSISHFTVAALDGADCIDVDAMYSITGLTPRQTAINKIALLDESIGRCSSLNVEYAEKILRDIILEWYIASGGVSDYIESAVANPSTYLDSALNELHSWFHWSEYHFSHISGGEQSFEEPIPCTHPNQSGFCIDNNDLAKAAAVRINEAFENAMTRESQVCEQAGQNDDRKLLDLLKTVWLLELGGPTGGLTFYESAGVPEWDDLWEFKTCGIYDVELRPTSSEACIGEISSLDIKVLDKFDNVLNDYPFTSTAAEVGNVNALSIIQYTDELIKLDAIDEGSSGVEITGYTPRWSIPEFYPKSNIDVIECDRFVVVEPSFVTIKPGDTKPLTVHKEDDEGNIYPCESTEWYTITNYVDFVTTANDSCTIEALEVTEPTVNVSANCDGLVDYAVVKIEEPLTEPDGCYEFTSELACFTDHTTGCLARENADGFYFCVGPAETYENDGDGNAFFKWIYLSDDWYNPYGGVVSCRDGIYVNAFFQNDYQEVHGIVQGVRECVGWEGIVHDPEKHCSGEYSGYKIPCPDD